MGEVKGGIVIEQLKRYAKRLSDHTGDSVSVTINVWYHRHAEGNNFNITTSCWDSLARTRIEPFPKSKDLRKLGSLIEDYIKGGD